MRRYRYEAVYFLRRKHAAVSANGNRSAEKTANAGRRTAMPLGNLDKTQRRAATAEGGEIAISAGAGSGKTRLLVARYLYLLKRDALPLSSIAAITFTNKAADQMKARIFD